MREPLCSSENENRPAAGNASALGEEVGLGVSVRGAPRVGDPALGEEVGLGVSVRGAPRVDDEEVEEGRAPRTRECPEILSSEAFRVHSLTHIPYHPGCKHCVAARKRDHRHPRRPVVINEDGETTGIASACADYFFPRDGPGEEKVTALAVCVRLRVAIPGRPCRGVQGGQCRTYCQTGSPRPA